MNNIFCKSDFTGKQQLPRLLLLFLCFIISFSSLSMDLGKGFFDHGVTYPVSSHRGCVATVDGNGRNVVLLWLYDHRGGYALLMIDAETGKSEEFPIPFKLDVPYGDTPYSSILSSKNKFYTFYNSNFVEFDPVKRAFTFTTPASPQMAMAMTEDDHGVIWAVTYPKSGVVSFNPETREFKDYGYVYNQNWRQYPRNLVTDDKGYLYFSLGNTASQIIIFNPAAKEAKPVLPEAERKRGAAFVYRDLNGKVYGKALNSLNDEWYEFYKGEAHKIGKHEEMNPRKLITGSQNLFHQVFPDGKRIKTLDLENRILFVEDLQKKTEKKVSFDYTSDGALVMGVGTSPDNTIVGGTTFPMRFFRYNPRTDKFDNAEAFGQFNALASQGNRFYFGSYSQGALLEWDPSKRWVNTKVGEKTNPLHIAASSLVTHRPHRILAYTDGKTIIMSGTPEYGYTGGGLIFWDRKKKDPLIVKDSVIILDQSTMSMVALPGGKFLGGTTTQPGTGGEKKAKEAELYIMDVVSKKVEWHAALIPEVQSYSDLCVGADGLIYGIAETTKFFVFDPVKRTIIHQENVDSTFGRTTSAQSPRILITGPNKNIYVLFVKGIVKVEPGTFKLSMIAESPLPIIAGGDYLDGKIYFISGSHLISYKL